jgi:hypothetical protein
MLAESCLVAPQDMFVKLRPRHGILLASWDELEMVGFVQALGVVQSVNSLELKAVVSWCASDIILRPNPSGKKFWRTKQFFKFAKDVGIRYMLDDLFAEHFPTLEQMTFGRVTGLEQTTSFTQYQETPGYVYLIESEYGYKIGKTVNIKSRTKLFEVKLPFPIKLINYSWFDNYSRAESDLHKKFAHKRLEGEWFALDSADIEYIKNQGKQVLVDF